MEVRPTSVRYDPDSEAAVCDACNASAAAARVDEDTVIFPVNHRRDCWAWPPPRGAIAAGTEALRAYVRDGQVVGIENPDQWRRRVYRREESAT